MPKGINPLHGMYVKGNANQCSLFFWLKSFYFRVKLLLHYIKCRQIDMECLNYPFICHHEVKLRYLFTVLNNKICSHIPNATQYTVTYSMSLGKSTGSSNWSRRLSSSVQNMFKVSPSANSVLMKFSMSSVPSAVFGRSVAASS